MDYIGRLLLAPTNILWTAIISAIVSAGISYFVKKRETRDKLGAEYEYEQRKKLRELIGKYHGRLLNACVSLNHRLWNLYNNEGHRWLCMKGQYDNPGYYFTSFVYRFLNVCSLVRQIENEAIMLDTRIADPKDFTFLNYMAAMHWVMTDVALFDGLKYDNNYAIDHFFSDKFRQYSETCIIDGQFMTIEKFQEYLNNNRSLDNVCRFFDGLEPNENRLRWDRLVAFHLIIMSFINTFGYKRQYSSENHFEEAAGRAKNINVLQNLTKWLPRHDLENDREVSKINRALDSIKLE